MQKKWFLVSHVPNAAFVKASNTDEAKRIFQRFYGDNNNRLSVDRDRTLSDDEFEYRECLHNSDVYVSLEEWEDGSLIKHEGRINAFEQKVVRRSLIQSTD